MYDPSSGTLEGSVRVDVHYYEDANVRLLTDKQTSAALSGPTSDADAVTQRIVKQIAGFEKSYQQDLNLAFVELSEGAFKSLRRQLPITRQKVDWDKIGGYRVRFRGHGPSVSGGILNNFCSSGKISEEGG